MKIAVKCRHLVEDLINKNRNFYVNKILKLNKNNQVITNSKKRPKE